MLFGIFRGSSAAIVRMLSSRFGEAEAEGVMPGVNAFPRLRPLGSAPDSDPKTT
jgi:hypothetical protein